MNSIVSSSCNKCNKVFDKSMPTCRCYGIRHPFESAMDYQTTSGTSSNIGQYHKESVAGVLTGGIGQITTTNGFNDPPKGYVPPNAEELIQIMRDAHKVPRKLVSQQLADGELELNISMDGNEHPVIKQGWECPRCHSINAPFVNKCGCK